MKRLNRQARKGYWAHQYNHELNKRLSKGMSVNEAASDIAQKRPELTKKAWEAIK